MLTRMCCTHSGSMVAEKLVKCDQDMTSTVAQAV